VDLDRFHPPRPGEREGLRAQLGLARDARVAIYTGRFLRGKGLEMLLEAFARVASRDREAHLVLAGSGDGQALSVEDALRARAAAPGLAGRVSFPGRVENVPDWLRAADVFVFPSLFEALGLSLVEASACGLPGLGTRTGGIVDVIEDGASGRLLPPNDVESWTASLADLLADPERRAILGARAAAVARARFDARDAVERYRALFDELAAVRRRPDRAAVGAARS
jgi:glycosyltransferase involved in cell wall biosynthesis